jgi:prophage regulatory protein
MEPEMENQIVHMLRLPEVERRTGLHRSKVYDRVNHGLLTPQVKLGGHTVAWPAPEIDAIMKARIAGRDNAAIKILVLELLVARGWEPEKVAAFAERAAKEGAKKHTAELIHEDQLATGKKAVRKATKRSPAAAATEFSETGAITREPAAS